MVGERPSRRSRYDFHATAFDELERGHEHESHVARLRAQIGRTEHVVPDQRRHDRLHLEHAILDADAVPVAGAEGYVRVRVPFATPVRQEVVRVEHIRVLVVLGARVQKHRDYTQRGTCGRTKQTRDSAAAYPKNGEGEG